MCNNTNMNVSIRQLQIFEAVAKTESFTRAAVSLDMTQPAVSMQMRQLEEFANGPLFERHGKNAVLTSVGLTLYEHVKKIIVQYQNMEAAMNEIKEVHGGSITISAATTANHFISHMLAGFSQHHENITFSLDITNRERLVKQLQDYVPDFVVMGEPPASLKLVSEVIMQNPLVMIASPNHPLAKKKNILMQEVMTEVLVIREKGSGTRATIERHFEKWGHKFLSSFEMGSNEAIKHAVVAGLGLGVVSLHTIKMELESKNLVILDVKTLPIMRHWHIVTRKGKHLSPAAKAFRAHILEEAQVYMNSYNEVAPSLARLDEQQTE